jgi:SHS2 domain-containing protein
MGAASNDYYRIMDVTADIGIITTAPDLSELFENAARALFDIMCDTLNVRPLVETEISAGGEDLPSTMVNWLNELLYVFETRDLILPEFQILSAEPHGVRARAKGEAYDPSRHSMLRHIKAVTYHRLKVQRTDEGWEAEVLFDI